MGLHPGGARHADSEGATHQQPRPIVTAGERATTVFQHDSRSEAMAFRRWTPLTFLFPGLYVESGPFWEEFDLEDWADDEYEWIQDPWNGFLDIAKPPSRTVEDAEGDCEDFALVAVSWALANGRSAVGLGFCWESSRPWPTHAIGYDEERVYSSGRITRTSVRDWRQESKYDLILRRRVR